MTRCGRYLILLAAILAASPAVAQTTPAAPAKAGVSGVWIDVNFIALSPAQKAQTYTWTTMLYGEPATAATAYPALPTAYGVGLEGGYQFKNGLGFGLHWTQATYDYSVGLALSIPHPFYYNAYASDADTTASSLTRKDTAVDISVTYVPHTPDRWRIRLFGGPTYFSVSQEMVSDIGYDQIYGFSPSYNLVTITDFSQETVEGNTWGFHGGADVAYFFSRHVGVGGVVRVNGGSVDVDEPLSEQKATLKLGGVLLGAGVRFRF
jgi:hypothetical protein